MSKRNETSFNWAGLSTELKERILIHNCTDYPSLMCVSRQVRAIIIAILFRIDIFLKWEHPLDMLHDLRRLDRNPQFGARVTARDAPAVKLYKFFPFIYPELSRFATFKHAVRKVSLDFDFHTYLHFFKVTTNGFVCGGPHTRISCDHFFQLPNLHEVTIKLPDNENRLSERSRYFVRIFDNDDPCPRALHRAIYERIAEVLVYVPIVNVTGFIEAAEEARYLELRQHALDHVKFTREELTDLYANEDGGIKLTRAQAFVDTRKLDYDSSPPWRTPACYCDVPCEPIFKGLNPSGWVRRWEENAQIGKNRVY